MAETVTMIGTMVLTALETLSEHRLLKPESEIKNIPIMCLMLLEFLTGDATDLDCHWGCEVVRLCDDAGIKLEESVRKQVSLSKAEVKEFREEYHKKIEGSEYGQGKGGNGNGYERFAKKKDWKPQDDWNTQAEYGDERLWYRWDWKMEVGSFQFYGIE